MIKATGRIGGKETILLGLSEGNCKKLLEGLPIHIKGHDIGITYNIIIMGGKTEQDIVDELKQAGMLEGTLVLPSKPEVN